MVCIRLANVAEELAMRLRIALPDYGEQLELETERIYQLRRSARLTFLSGSGPGLLSSQQISEFADRIFDEWLILWPRSLVNECLEMVSTSCPYYVCREEDP